MSFYLPLGDDHFRPTRSTESPWDSEMQHGGPPAALLGHTLEFDAGGEGGIFARLTFEFLGPVPWVSSPSRRRPCGPGAGSPCARPPS